MRIFKELGLDKFTKLSIYNDNIGAQHLAKNHVVHSRTKHIDIRFYFVRDAIKRYNFVLNYMSSAQMSADVLKRCTKPLVKTKHYFCIDTMYIVSIRNIDV